MSAPGLKERPRILLTVPHFTLSASPARHMLALAKWLPRLGYSLTVCSLRENGIEEVATKFAEWGVNHHVARFRPRHRNLRSITSSLKEGSRLLRDGKFDLVHSLDFTNSPFEALLCRAYRTPYLFHQRNLNPDGSALALSIKARQARKIVAVTRAVRQYLVTIGGQADRIHVVPNSIDTEDLQLMSECSASPLGPPIRLVVIASMERRKRIEDAIDALSELRSIWPEIELQIAGPTHDIAYEGELRQRVKLLGLEKQVRFLGRRSDIPELMSGASCLVFPSRSEGFGWVVLEAMAVGLPVVASNIPGPADAIVDGQSGFLVDVGDVKGYVSAITRILEDSTLRGLFVKEARMRIEKCFSAKAMATSVASLYDAVISREL